MTQRTVERARRGGRMGLLCLIGLVFASSRAADVAHPALWPAVHPAPLVDVATEARIAALVKRMSLEEKVGQTIQTDISTVTPADLRTYPLGSVLAGGDSGPYGDERAAPAQWLRLAREFHAVALEVRPGHEPIPILFGIDAVHGHNNVVGAELFPHNIGLGAAHEPDLARRIGEATAEEVATTGIDYAFAPTIAVPQDVRWGRTYEGYSADPQAVAQYAAAAVLGLQGPTGLPQRLARGHVAASVKHFLGDGGTTLGEDQGNTEVSEETLVRTHAPGYAAGIEAGALTVMASYSSWNGQKMHAAKTLLTDVLKGQMGFQGVVIGDYNAHAQIPGCTKKQCPEAFNAGLDMYMAPLGWRDLYANLIADVKAGRIPMSRLDDAVTRILRVKFALGMFEPARPYEGQFERLASPEHRALAREAVRKSLVLLKNDGVLPIRANAKVVIGGPHAGSLAVQAGGWTITWQGEDTRVSDFPQAELAANAIKAAIRAGGGRVLQESDDLSSDKPDVAIVFIGTRPYAEMFGDIKLPIYNERTGLRALNAFKRLGIPTVTVFLSGRPLWTNPEINASDAFVAAWLPGSEGGGIADVLIGDAAGQPRYDFTGRLSFPWPRSALLPPFAANGATEFPIGYGLSYAAPARTPRLSERLDGTGDSAPRPSAPR
jgi:beta-glucosidase